LSNHKKDIEQIQKENQDLADENMAFRKEALSQSIHSLGLKNYFF